MKIAIVRSDDGFTATQNGREIGRIRWHEDAGFNGDDPYLDWAGLDLYVSDAAREQGVGRALLTAARDLACLREVDSIRGHITSLGVYRLDADVLGPPDIMEAPEADRRRLGIIAKDLPRILPERSPERGGKISAAWMREHAVEATWFGRSVCARKRKP